MTILSAALSLLGVNDTLPANHVECEQVLHEREASIESKCAAEEMRANAIRSAANTAKRTALAELIALKLERFAKLDVTIAASLSKALAAFLRALVDQPTRVAAREIAKFWPQHDAWAHETLGCGLRNELLAVLLAQALIEEDPSRLGAFAALDQFNHPAMFALAGSHSGIFCDPASSACSAQVPKLLAELEALERALLHYAETHACAADADAKARWEVQLTSATASAFRDRWFALVEQQKAEADAASAPERERLRAAWLVKQAQIGNESAEAVAKAEGISIPKLETLDEPEDDELEGDEADETDDEHDDEHDDEEHSADAGNADPASYEEAGYIGVDKGTRFVG
jgi:hypothetical protein